MSRHAWLREAERANQGMAGHTEEYDHAVDGIPFIVHPNVFSPRYFTDSAWFAQEVPKLVGKRSLLDVGTGTGIVALFAGLNGANGLAIDINPEAVANARENLTRHGVHFDARQSDLYGKVRDSERFDVLFWNHPFNRTRPPRRFRRFMPELLQAGFDEGYRALEGYIAGADAHLETGGQLLLGTGSGADQWAIGALAEKYGRDVRLLKGAEMPLVPGGAATNTYFLLELRRR